MANISVLDNRTIWMQVRSDHPILDEQDISIYPVEMAFVVAGTDPVEADWFPATWESTTVSAGRKNFYLCFLEVGVGSGTVEFEAGNGYRVWARVTAPTETPVIPGPLLIVT